jgi:hypothetical protein
MNAADIWNRTFRKLRLGPVYFPGPAAPPPGEGSCLKVGLRRQVDGFSCGVVAGWTVIQCVFPGKSFKDRFADFDRFYKACNPCIESGTSERALVRALRAEGVRVSLRQKSLAFGEVVCEIARGRPLVVCIDVPDTDYMHWVTVYGYRRVSRTKKWVYLANNHTKPVISFEEFARLQRGGYLVCSQRNPKPVAKKSRPVTRSAERR